MLVNFCDGRAQMLILLSEIFGASEDDSPEMDHSKDSENGERLRLLILIG